MLNVKAMCAAALFATISYAPQASAQCYRSFPSLTNGANGTTANGLGSESTNPGCEESAKKYPNSFGAGYAASMSQIGTAQVRKQIPRVAN